MDKVSETNFKAVQQVIKELTSKLEEQEKRINSYIQSHQMLMTTINTLQQEVCILKVMNTGNGPTEK